MKKMFLVLLVCVVSAPLMASHWFTPIIDGVREPGWENLIYVANNCAAANPPGFDLSAGFDVSNNDYLLHINIWLDPDPWGDGIASECQILIGNDDNVGIPDDPYEGNKLIAAQYVYPHPPDYIVILQWDQGAGGIVTWAGQVGINTGYAAFNGSFAPAIITSNDQCIEILIHKVVLEPNMGPIKPGDKLWISACVRPDQNKPGVNATSPCDTAANSDWANGTSSLLSDQKCYTWAAGKSPAQEVWVDAAAPLPLNEDTDNDDQFASIQAAINAIAPGGALDDGNDFNDVVRLYVNAPHVPAAQLAVNHATWIAADPTTTSKALIRTFDVDPGILISSGSPTTEIKFKNVAIIPNPQLDHNAGDCIGNAAGTNNITLSLENVLIAASNDGTNDPASDMNASIKRVAATMTGYYDAIFLGASLSGATATVNLTTTTLTQTRFYGVHPSQAGLVADININTGCVLGNIGSRAVFVAAAAAGSTLDIIGGDTPATRVKFHHNQTETTNYHGFDVRNSITANTTIKHADFSNGYGGATITQNDPSIYLYGGTHIIEDIHMWSMPWRGLRFSTNGAVTLKDSIIESCGSNCVFVGNGGSSLTASNCVFKNAGMIGVNIFDATAAQQISFSDCEFRDCQEAGLYVYANNGYIKDVNACLFYNNAQNAASTDKSNYFSNSDVATGATFRRCTFHDPSGTVPNVLFGVAAQPQTFLDCVFSGAGDTGIDMTAKGDNGVAINYSTFAIAGPDALAASVVGGTPTYTPAMIGHNPYYKSTNPASADFLTVTNPYLEFANSTGGALSGWGAYEKDATVPVELSVFRVE